MPIYVYEPTIYSIDEPMEACCYFESLQKMTEPALTQCPTCGHAVHRAIAPFFVGHIAGKPTRPEETSNSESTNNTNDNSMARNAARLAMRHVCGGGCQH